jgi:hypothetical protein
MEGLDARQPLVENSLADMERKYQSAPGPVFSSKSYNLKKYLVMVSFLLGLQIPIMFYHHHANNKYFIRASTALTVCFLETKCFNA